MIFLKKFLSFIFKKEYIRALHRFFPAFYALHGGATTVFENRGNLLGCWRNNSLLDFETDADFGIMKTEMDYILKNGTLKAMRRELIALESQLLEEFPDLCGLVRKFLIFEFFDF